MTESPNLFLSSLPAKEFAALRAHLRPVDLPQGEILFDVGDAIHQVYFPHSGIVSLVVSLVRAATPSSQP